MLLTLLIIYLCFRATGVVDELRRKNGDVGGSSRPLSCSYWLGGVGRCEDSKEKGEGSSCSKTCR